MDVQQLQLNMQTLCHSLVADYRVITHDAEYLAVMRAAMPRIARELRHETWSSPSLWRRAGEVAAARPPIPITAAREYSPSRAVGVLVTPEVPEEVDRLALYAAARWVGMVERTRGSGYPGDPTRVGWEESRIVHIEDLGLWFLCGFPALRIGDLCPILRGGCILAFRLDD